MNEHDRDARHKARMARKKALIDAAIARADQEKGLLLVLTGNGKGKSSSALGMMTCALGHGITGRGIGVDDARYARKLQVIRQSLALHDTADGLSGAAFARKALC
ncbi:MAG: cob(I)yrinic acid a,c-diamide adenosyltransferase [Gammaproteobacteria bacterium]|nr:cob(I)yrinic acid a,c-diamide adenosyltransferase [Gammaproteobacteria bacterium]